MPTIQDIYPCLLNHWVHNKQGNILCPVCIINLLRVIELQWRSQGGAGGANAPPQIFVVPLLPKTPIGAYIGLHILSLNKIFLKPCDSWL